MKARVQIDADVCGFRTTVDASSDDRQHLSREIGTDCDKIRGLSLRAQELPTTHARTHGNLLFVCGLQPSFNARLLRPGFCRLDVPVRRRQRGVRAGSAGDSLTSHGSMVLFP